MMNEETRASLNKFLKEREERIKNMTLAEARDIVSRIYGHSDMRMESDKALQMLLDCADKALEQTRWIPVIERLPEDRELILFSTKTDRVFEGRYFDDNTDRQWYSFRDDTFAWNNVVTAWMPLPEPYKEDKK